MRRIIGTIILALAIGAAPSWGDDQVITNDNPNPEWTRKHPGDKFERGFAMCIDKSNMPAFPGWRIPGYYRENWGVGVSTAGFLFDSPYIDALTGDRYIAIGDLMPRVGQGGIQGRDQYGRIWWFARNADQLRLDRLTR